MADNPAAGIGRILAPHPHRHAHNGALIAVEFLPHQIPLLLHRLHIGARRNIRVCTERYFPRGVDFDPGVLKPLPRFLLLGRPGRNRQPSSPRARASASSACHWTSIVIRVVLYEVRIPALIDLILDARRRLARRETEREADHWWPGRIEVRLR